MITSSPQPRVVVLTLTLCALADVAAQDWQQTATPATPSASIGCAMTYDESMGKIVLFGGHSNGTAHDSTWSLDSTGWTLLTPGTRPSPRTTTMTYDHARGRAVLFGGWDNTQRLNDTWEWDGTAWTQRLPSVSPPGRDSAAMVYDRGRARVVMFGGRGSNNSPLADTWEWDGATWTQHTPLLAPQGRWECSLAYDEARGRTLLFGGADHNTVFQDTWVWNGSAWTQLQPAQSPPARHGAAMTYDAARRRVVLFSGQGAQPGQFLSDTWEWNGAAWEMIDAASTPTPRWDSTVCFDRGRACTVMYGGLAAGGSGTPAAWLRDTWTYRTTPMPGGRFYLSEQVGNISPGILLELDDTGLLQATHNIGSQLPAGLSGVSPCEITPWGTLLCTTGYHPDGGWFDMDSQGRVLGYIRDAGGGVNISFGAQRASVDPSSHRIFGVHYDWTGPSAIRAFSRLGEPLWTTPVAEAIAPCVVNGQVHVGVFQVGPITALSTATGNRLFAYGAYRHVFVLKTLPNQRLLIGNQPTNNGPTDWIIRDLALGTESRINTSAHPFPNRHADVDDAGRIWILCGRTLVCYDATGTELGILPIAAPLPTIFEYGLVVSGIPRLPPAAAATSYGIGCAGSNGISTATALNSPVFGTTFQVAATNLPTYAPQLAIAFFGFSRTSWGFNVLPYNLAPYGLPGCSLWASPPPPGLIVSTFTQNGTCTWSYPVPTHPLFLGVHLYFQALIPDAQAGNPLGATVTNGIDLLLGM